MCIKYFKGEYTAADAKLLMNEQFTYVNVIQLTIVCNIAYNNEYINILQELNLLMYIFQSITDDGKIAKVTIVYDSRKIYLETLKKQLKKLEKKYSNGKKRTYILC